MNEKRIIITLRDLHRLLYLHSLSRFFEYTFKKYDSMSETLEHFAKCMSTAIIIIGRMGIGKTTIAQILAYLALNYDRNVTVVANDEEFFNEYKFLKRIDFTKKLKFISFDQVKNDKSLLREHDTITILEESVVNLGVGKGRLANQIRLEDAIVTSRHRAQLYVIVSQHEELSEAMKRIMKVSYMLLLNNIAELKLQERFNLDEYIIKRLNMRPTLGKLALLMSSTTLSIPLAEQYKTTITNSSYRECIERDAKQYRLIIYDEAFQKLVNRVKQLQKTYNEK